MRRALVLTLTLVLTAALASAASAAIRITKIYYDSPGSDTPITNAKLNGEWIRLKNTGGAKKSLKGWKVRDGAGHVYTFGTYTLGAGKTVTIHTGSGANRARHRYWGQGNYIWNNDKDKATLKKPSGTTADTCSYNSTAVDFKNC
jgi:hypothetical protein